MAAIRRPFQRNAGAIPQLDGIRAIAIVMVLARHGLRAHEAEFGQSLTLAGFDLGGPVLNGWAGVDLFFVLSGFLIACSLLRRSNTGHALPDMRRYLTRRVLRIVPAYYVVLAIAVLGVVPHYEVPREYLGAQVAYHLLFLQDYLPSGIVVAFWSLGVEEKFYLSAPLVWMVAMKIQAPRRRYAALLALPVAAVAFRAMTFAGTPPTSYESYFATLRSPFHLALDPLYIGVLAAMVYADRDHLAWTQRWSTVRWLFSLSAGAVCVLLGAGELLADPITWFDATLQPLFIAMAFGGLVLSVALGGGPIRMLSARSLFVVSKLSYSLYLVHLLVIPATIAWTSGWWDGDALLPGVHLAAFTLIYLTTSSAFAIAVHLAVEHPFLVLNDRMSLGGGAGEARNELTRTSELPQRAAVGTGRTA